MLLPNKLFSYNEGILSKLPVILNNLSTPLSPKQLYYEINAAITPIEFMEALDCLYALGKIDITKEGRLYIC